MAPFVPKQNVAMKLGQQKSPSKPSCEEMPATSSANRCRLSPHPIRGNKQPDKFRRKRNGINTNEIRLIMNMPLY